MKRVTREIDLREVVDIIKKRVWMVIIITVLSTVAGAMYSTYNTTYLYQSSTRVIIGASAELMTTLQVIIKDTTILEKVVQEMNLEKSPEALSSQITISSIGGSQVVSINVTDTDANRAADIANTTARVFKEEIPNILEFDDVRVLSEAKVNPYPINETQNRTIILAFVFGLAVSIGLTFLLDSFDDTVRPDHDVEEIFDLPLLGRVSKMNKKNIKKKGQYQQAVGLRGENVVTK
jgi:capsular polysaccharide biosynthesis protein